MNNQKSSRGRSLRDLNDRSDKTLTTRKMLNNKKAMGVGQVFIFIVAAITFALIAIFGFKAIKAVMDSGEQVQFVQFKNELESSIKRIYTEYGSVRKETFNPGAEFTRICFVDLSRDYNDALCAQNQIACDLWKTAQDEAIEQNQERNQGTKPVEPYDLVDQNVFLTPQVSIPIKVHHIELFADAQQTQRVGYLCRELSRGSFTVILEGKGDHTAISPDARN